MSTPVRTANPALAKAMAEKRSSSAASPHRNRRRYNRTEAKRTTRRDFA